MNLFGKAKKQPSTRESITQLRETVETLEKRERHLQTKIDTELQQAKQQMHKQNKKQALMALKRKRMYEQEVEKIMGARMTLETQTAMLEGANVNLETMQAMKQGADAMKRIHGSMKIEQVDSTMDEIRDQMDIMNEISEAIAQPVGYGVDLDDEELAAELDALEQQELDEKLLGVPANSGRVSIGAGGVELPAMPGVPSNEPSIAQPPRPQRQLVPADGGEDDDAELAALRASMSI